MRGRHGFQRGGFRAKRPMQWVANAASYVADTPIATVSGTTASAILVSTVGGASAPPSIDRFTVERIRGNLSWVVLPSANAQTAHVSAGILKVTSDAAGTVVLPNPNTAADGETPWLWLRHCSFNNGAADTYIEPGAQLSWEVDVRTKRVMRDNEQLLLVFVANFTAGMTVSAVPYLRTLISRVA